MQIIEIPDWLESASADFICVVAVLTAGYVSNALLTVGEKPDAFKLHKLQQGRKAIRRKNT